MESVFKHFTLIKDWLHDQFNLQAGQFFLWMPVFFGAGIGLYFSLPQEPGLFLCLTLWGICCLALWLCRRAAFVRFVLLALVLVVSGCLAGQVRALLVDAPVLERSLSFVSLEGRITQFERMDKDGRSARFVLCDLTLDRLAPVETPACVRLSVRSKKPLLAYDPGDFVAGLASLRTPSDPVAPDGFDFRRHLYFQRIGAVGFFYGAPQLVDKTADHVWNNRVERLRNAINTKVFSLIPALSPGLVSALLTGQRGAMNEADMEAMRASGLAHMLAISGLHVGLFAATVFFVVRLGLVLIPALALHWPVKRIAAVTAFVAAVFYMLLAGATLPTQRAVIMVGVVLLAVFLDRSALSMRLVAVAALLVLLFAPESLLSVSFQLSFAAVIGLIAVYDGLRDFLSVQMRHSGFVRRALLYGGGIVLTSAIASVVTMPFALHYFQRASLYAVLANALAMPVMSFWVMPSAVMALFLMPFGGSALFLALMGQGAGLILDIAHRVAALEGAQVHFSFVPLSALLAFSLGALFMCLWRGPLRWLGLLGVLIALLLCVSPRRPDIVIGQDHTLWAYIYAADKSVDKLGDEASYAALDQDQPTLFVSTMMRGRFVREAWQSDYGLQNIAPQHWRADEALISCDDLACRLVLKGRKISFVLQKEALAQACAWADIVISKRSVRKKTCAAPLVIDYWFIKKHGASALYLSEDGDVPPRIETALDQRVHRLWRP